MSSLMYCNASLTATEKVSGWPMAIQVSRFSHLLSSNFSVSIHNIAVILNMVKGHLFPSSKF